MIYLNEIIIFQCEIGISEHVNKEEYSIGERFSRCEIGFLTVRKGKWHEIDERRKRSKLLLSKRKN